MKKGRVKFENHGLLILLGVLCVAIVGLGVGIIVIDLRNEVADGEYEVGIIYDGGQTELDKSIANGYYPGDGMSSEAYEHDYAYLTGMINTGQTEDGQQLNDSDKFFLKMTLVRLMVRYGKFIDALEYLDQINKSNISSQELGEMYVSYSLVYEGMGDQDNALKYADMAVDLNGMED